MMRFCLLSKTERQFGDNKCVVFLGKGIFEAYLSQHSAGAERAEKVCSSPANLSCCPEQT